MRRQGIRTAYIWMLFVFINTISWLLILIIPRGSFSPLILSNWFRLGDINIGLNFALNDQNWILALSLLAFNLSYFLTGIARLDVRNDPISWIFQLLMTAFAFLAIMSADLWSLVLIWTALDLLNLVFDKMITKSAGSQISYNKLIFKFLGSILLIWNVALLNTTGFNPLLSGVLASAGGYSLFFAALLHSGIFPLTLESNDSSENESKKLISTSFYITNFIVSFILVINLPAPNFSFLFSVFVNLISLIIIVFSMIQWALNKNFQRSLKFLLLGEAGSFFYLYSLGATQFLPFILALFFLSVLWMILFSHRGKILLIFSVISTFFVSGLPMTLITYGTRSYFKNGFSIGLFILIFMQIMFLLGFIKNTFNENEKFGNLDVWYQAAYLTGLFLPLLSIGAIIIEFSNIFGR